MSESTGKICDSGARSMWQILKVQTWPLPAKAGKGIAQHATMVQFGERRRSLVAKQLSDVANLSLAALAFGQFIRGEGFSASALLLGIGLWLVFVALAFAVAGGKDP